MKSSNLQNVPLPGTPYYYAFRFAPPPARAALTVIYGFNNVLTTLVNQGTEVHITQMKLNWWSQEVARLYTGGSSHPLSAAMIKVIQDYQITQDRWQNLINAHIKNMEDKIFLNENELVQFAHQVAAPQFILYSQVLSKDSSSIAFATELGSALYLIERINTMGKDWRRGKLFIPETEFMQQHVPLADFPQQCPPEFVPTALRKIAKIAEQHAEQALALLPPNIRYQQLSLLILWQLEKTLLNEIRRANFAVLAQQYHLTPLRQLWIALRTKFLEKRSLHG